MSIVSLEFLALAAGTLLLYYVLPLKARPYALVLAGAAFVCLSGWYGAVHLSVAALFMWGGGLLLAKRKSKALLALFLCIVLGAMAFIKYAPSLFGAALIVPLGLSYFSFQSAGYLIDAYRGKITPVRSPLKAWLFIGYFPQLSQGPISSWKELGAQLLTGHRFEPVPFVSGFQLLLWGYFKKLVIADRLAAVTDALQAHNALPGWFILCGAALYAVRLYMDFSGGMDVVRGLSRMLGIELPENFRRPFFARSVADYWRRWHITLGAWFRSYLLYPLVTSRAMVHLGKAASGALGKKTGRALPGALSTLLVFLLIGVWHTANWNAVVYGAYFGVVMAASMLLTPLWKTMRLTLNLSDGGVMSLFRLLRTWALVLIAQYFAFTADPAQGISLLRGTFANFDFSAFSSLTAEVMPTLEWLIAGLGCLAVLIVDVLCEKNIDVCNRLASARVLVRWPLLLLILAVTVLGLYGAGYDGAVFLYTQF